MANYFRITAYYPEKDFSVILDSNGMFEKLWMFSSYLVQKGFKILEVGNEEKFLDGNFEKDAQISDKYLEPTQKVNLSPLPTELGTLNTTQL